MRELILECKDFYFSLTWINPIVQIVDKMMIGNKIDTFIGILPVFPNDEKKNIK